MKKIICLLLVVLSGITISFAQDKIVKGNGEIISGQVLEIKTEVITYKKATNLTGPTYEILKTDVHKIIFKNGSEEIITALSKEGKTGIEFKFLGGDTIQITKVPQGSPAEEIGIKEGDKIIQIDNVKVGKFSSESNVYNLLDGPPGTVVSISLIRGKLTSPLTLPVERRVKNWDVPKNDPIVVYEDNNDNNNNDNSNNTPPNYDTNNNNNTTSDDGSTYNYNTNTTRSNNNTDVAGFYISIMPGIGGANFREPFLGIFEFEIGECVPSLNTTFALKTAVYHMPEADDLLISLKYSTTGYLGKYTKQGFFVGGDVGMAFYPAGDQPLWDFAATTGYSFRFGRSIRLEGVGSVNFMPTLTFSNFGIGGFVGIRFGGIF